MTARDELTIVHVDAAVVDIVADYYNVASILIDGVAACVVTNVATGGKIRFESHRVPSQRVAGDQS